MAELSLALAAFFAATILPFSSEAAFVVALSNGMPIANALLSASIGNILAIIVNFYLGVFLYEKTKAKLFRSKIGKKSYSFGHKYGYWALLLSWLPIVGDPLTLVAGLVRLKFVWFVIIAGSLRVLRYYFLTFLG
ncbi:YqaA family protein [Sulfurimonas microaerophilic]|uniref:YqaA family protein n=1 Tax=Sulfurimonas microaerophilic TaxID=3058392 RepID=UPI0027145A2F|nr:DedA family protein [Sulfurimonas sp. hsl 1-7]